MGIRRVLRDDIVCCGLSLLIATMILLHQSLEARDIKMIASYIGGLSNPLGLNYGHHSPGDEISPPRERPLVS